MHPFCTTRAPRAAVVALVALGSAGCVAEGLHPAPGVTLTRVELLQGPAHVLGDAAGVPVVAGRPALVRLHYRTDAAYDGEPVVGAVALGDQRFETVDRLYGASSPGRLSSTLNVEIPGAALALGTHDVTAAILQETTDDTGTASADYTLDVTVPATSLRVHLVPFDYLGDGSGRPPYLTATRRWELEETLLSHYPAAQVELTVGAPEPFTQVVAAESDAADWMAVASETAAVREREAPEDDVLYYGMLRSTPLNVVCASGYNDEAGCVAGLALSIPTLDDPGTPIAAGQGYPETRAITALVHEVGHLAGRAHAPCGGAAGADPAYPHDGAAIGVDGWDMAEGRLRLAAATRDIMSYCDPSFVSDYTWTHVAERLTRWAAAADPSAFRERPISAGTLPAWDVDADEPPVRLHVRWATGENHAPIEGGRVCVAGTDACEDTDPRGRAVHEAPPGAELALELDTSEHYPAVFPLQVGEADAQVSAFAFTRATGELALTQLPGTQAADRGILLFLLEEGGVTATVDLDADGPHYTNAAGLYQPALTASEPGGLVVFTNVAAGEGTVTFGGVTACEHAAWSAGLTGARFPSVAGRATYIAALRCRD